MSSLPSTVASADLKERCATLQRRLDLVERERMVVRGQNERLERENAALARQLEDDHGLLGQLAREVERVRAGLLAQQRLVKQLLARPSGGSLARVCPMCEASCAEMSGEAFVGHVNSHFDEE